MILEGIVTTLTQDGKLNISPMGPQVEEPAIRRLVLRPYKTSRTYRNLKEYGEGVFHVTDDVWLLARAAIGQLEHAPGSVATDAIRGRRLVDTCRWYEFRVVSLNDRQQRTEIECEVVHVGRVRDFVGFNRAKHAVVEAAILATRVDFLPMGQILEEFKRLVLLVKKTGGQDEHLAFEFLHAFVQRVGASSEQ